MILSWGYFGDRISISYCRMLWHEVIYLKVNIFIENWFFLQAFHNYSLVGRRKIINILITVCIIKMVNLIYSWRQILTKCLFFFPLNLFIILYRNFTASSSTHLIRSVNFIIWNELKNTTLEVNFAWIYQGWNLMLYTFLSSTVDNNEIAGIKACPT